MPDQSYRVVRLSLELGGTDRQAALMIVLPMQLGLTPVKKPATSSLSASAKYQPTAKFTTWLFTITRNLVFNETRKRQRRSEVSMDEREEAFDHGDVERFKTLATAANAEEEGQWGMTLLHRCGEEGLGVPGRRECLQHLMAFG